MLSDSGLYHVEVKNFCGMQQSNTIEAHPASTSNGFIPNVVTPNGDGKNDFLLLDKSLRNPAVTIINRWGSPVYSSSSYNNEWGGADLAPGTYFLVIRHQCLPRAMRDGWL